MKPRQMCKATKEERDYYYSKRCEVQNDANDKKKQALEFQTRSTTPQIRAGMQKKNATALEQRIITVNQNT